MNVAFRHLRLLFDRQRPCVSFASVRFRVSAIRRVNPKSRRAQKHSEKSEAQKFVDFKRIQACGGNGGNGCMSFMRLFANEWAGPDGGDGGNGGHVIFQADFGAKSLVNVSSRCIGERGSRGQSKHCHGANADNTVVHVPVGTFFRDVNGTVTADLQQPGDSYLAARGGAGGKGNYFFLTNENRAPTTYEEGGRGEEKVIYAELRAIADVGMVGFPNVGKSTLLRALTRAAPQVSNYPFTTLYPHIGIIECEDYEQIAVADIPGIIENAHLNRGLGFSFLRHIERCHSLLFVVDLSAVDPCQQLDVLRYELEQYEAGLSRRPHVVIGNKIDLPDTEENADRLREFVGSSASVLTISAKRRTNVDTVSRIIKEMYYAKCAEKPAATV